MIHLGRYDILRLDLDRGIVLSDIPMQELLELFGYGSREGERLLDIYCSGSDIIDIIYKSHIQHTIHLI